MFEKYSEMWADYGFEIVIATCLGFLVLYGLYRKFVGRTGSWYSNRQYYNYLGQAIVQNDSRQPATYQQQQPYYPSPRSPGGESKGEIECRRVLQKIFNRPFNKARPDFLQNPVTGGSRNLELDCYEPSLGIACEYNGEQHYKYIPYFHKNKEAFYNSKYRDEMKKQKCKEYGIKLIEVPYTVKQHDIENYIRQELHKQGIQI